MRLRSNLVRGGLGVLLVKFPFKLFDLCSGVAGQPSGGGYNIFSSSLFLLNMASEVQISRPNS